MLLIDNAQQAGLITVPACLAALESAFLGLADGLRRGAKHSGEPRRPGLPRCAAGAER